MSATGLSEDLRKILNKISGLRVYESDSNSKHIFRFIYFHILITLALLVHCAVKEVCSKFAPNKANSDTTLCFLSISGSQTKFQFVPPFPGIFINFKSYWANNLYLSGRIIKSQPQQISYL